MVRSLDGVNQCISTHGAITKHLITSATKRIYGCIISEINKEITNTRLNELHHDSFIMVDKKEYDDMKDRLRRHDEHMKQLYNPQATDV